MHRYYRTGWRLRYYLLTFTCLILVYAVVTSIYSVQFITTSPAFPIRKDVIKVAEGTSHEYLNIFNASEEDSTEKNTVNSNKCVPLRTTIGITPICVYDPSIDKYVSGSIVREGMWEPNIVYTVASLLKENPDMQLFDLGCNIGVFTLQVALMGRKVTAIDANKFNLRLLSKSLRLGGLGTNVTLIWNAVSDVHETIKLKITTGNIGKTFVKSERELNSTSNGNYEDRTTLAITLEDLINFFSGVPVFIKMDIEGSEWRALRGGERFFQQVDVRYVLMEWVHFKNTDNALDVIRYMTSFSFKPYVVNDELKRILAIENSHQWPKNILWVKT